MNPKTGVREIGGLDAGTAARAIDTDVMRVGGAELSPSGAAAAVDAEPPASRARPFGARRRDSPRVARAVVGGATVLLASALAIAAPVTMDPALPHAQAAPYAQPSSPADSAATTSDAAAPGQVGGPGAAVPAGTAVAVNASADQAELGPLVELVLRRLNTADAVAAAKWDTSQRTGRPPVVDDPQREAQVYDAMAEAGAAHDLPQDWVRQVFAGQIDANKIVQHGLLTRWRFDPAAAPAPDAAGLSAVRPIIDQVNGQLLAQLAAHRATLAAPDCPQRLAQAVFPVLTSGRADALHAGALVRAAVSLCPATHVK